MEPRGLSITAITDMVKFSDLTRRGVMDISLVQPSVGSQELLTTEFDDESMKELTDGYKAS